MFSKQFSKIYFRNNQQLNEFLLVFCSQEQKIVLKNSSET